MKNFEPLNRHLLVRLCTEEKKEESSFVLPDDYQAPKDPYQVVDVIATAPDCSIDVESGDAVVVERSQIHTLKVEGDEYHLVLQNHVYGVLP